MSTYEPKQYWKGSRGPDVGDSVAAASGHDLSQWMEEPPGQVDRRNFLKAAGFTLAGAAAATGCSKPPIHYALPHLVQPENVVPGRAAHYASVCGACEAGCGTLVKTRDGRPIKMEGLPGHPTSSGGLCAVGQASLLGLYDSYRLQQPQAAGQATTWEALDSELKAHFEGLRSTGASVRFLTTTLVSPTTREAMGRFMATFTNARHITHDSLSCSAILDAHEKTHGLRVLPSYDFSKAQLIVAFDADFLGTWINPVGFTAGYRAGRVLDDATPHMSRHVQFESRMSLTGSNADTRYRVAPEDLGLILSHLAARVAHMAGSPLAISGLDKSPLSEIILNELAEQLWHAQGQSLVVCGSQDVQDQILCNFLNEQLNNYGKTLDVERPSYQKQGSDRDLAELIAEIRNGKVDALFIAGFNMAYELPRGAELIEAAKRKGLVIYFAERPDETTTLASYVCATPHFLESWSDSEPVHGLVSLRQPVIRPLRNTRSLLECLNIWSGRPSADLDAIRAFWEVSIHPRSTDGKSFVAFWDASLSNGFTTVGAPPMSPVAFDRAQVRVKKSTEPAPEGSYTLVVYPKVALGAGQHAFNPWLQELPDPITKVTWDNYACLSLATADQLGLLEGDVVRIENGEEGVALELPVFIQPGQHDGVVAVALGYGQVTSKRFSGTGPKWIQGKATVGEDGRIGKNVIPMLALENGALQTVRRGVKLVKTREHQELASTQTYHSLSVPEHLAPAGGLHRPIIQETTLAAYTANPSAGSFHPHLLDEDLYPEDHEYRGHHWGMAIDLSACTGCSACVIACQAENNVPVVGKDEVRRRREMHWIRIDRYYSGEGDDIDVAHQPMLCQQCDNASCENVCPVLATVHTEEGLNAQVYNRCVGTRYCANNCPYKVRRFNWFKYRHDDLLENMVLNPDVSVRSRGVMEKCSFCVQRLQEAKIEAKRNGATVTDAAVQPACQQSCPAQAIVLGDMNDPESKIAKLIASPRHYRVLEEINVRPSVGYLTLVRNRAHGEEGTTHHA